MLQLEEKKLPPFFHGSIESEELVEISIKFLEINLGPNPGLIQPVQCLKWAQIWPKGALCAAGDAEELCPGLGLRALRGGGGHWGRWTGFPGDAELCDAALHKRPGGRRVGRMGGEVEKKENGWKGSLEILIFWGDWTWLNCCLCPPRNDQHIFHNHDKKIAIIMISG